ncbi:hypothetical protein N7488_002158 [Penicillium malachiteum]|nr:hypothetical protein N7488_002158 [Penicillium malachiteum]
MEDNDRVFGLSAWIRLNFLRILERHDFLTAGRSTYQRENEEAEMMLRRVVIACEVDNFALHPE